MVQRTGKLQSKGARHAVERNLVAAKKHLTPMLLLEVGHGDPGTWGSADGAHPAYRVSDHWDALPNSVTNNPVTEHRGCRAPAFSVVLVSPTPESVETGQSPADVAGVDRHRSSHEHRVGFHKCRDEVSSPCSDLCCHGLAVSECVLLHERNLEVSHIQARAERR